MKLIAQLKLKPTTDGGRDLPVKLMFKPSVSIGEGTSNCTVLLLGRQILKPGEICDVEVSIPEKFGRLKPQEEVKFYEGFREVGTGTVRRIVK